MNEISKKNSFALQIKEIYLDFFSVLSHLSLSRKMEILQGALLQSVSQLLQKILEQQKWHLGNKYIIG